MKVENDTKWIVGCKGHVRRFAARYLRGNSVVSLGEACGLGPRACAEILSRAAR